MKKYISLFAFLVLLIPGHIFGQQIKEMKFSKSIEDRSPVKVDTAFSEDVGTVFCFTKVTNVPDTTQITHVWYYKGKEKARISLAVKAERWRTWSSKKILPKWTGKWSVKVESESGNVMATKSFVIN